MNLGYGINFKYEGILSHSFDRLYVVMKICLPMVKDLRLPTIQFDSTCKYLSSGIGKTHYPDDYIPNLKAYHKKIEPFVHFYKKQIEYYNLMFFEIFTKDLSLILPTFPKERKQKRGIITSLISGFISLAYEGISSFLDHKRHKALQKVVVAMEDKVDMQ